MRHVIRRSLQDSHSLRITGVTPAFYFISEKAGSYLPSLCILFPVYTLPCTYATQLSLYANAEGSPKR